jgi:hypothetical protein
MRLLQALCATLSVAAAEAAACKITGQQWTMNNTLGHGGGTNGLGNELLVAQDLSMDGSGSPFNITGVNLHAYGGKAAAMNSNPWQGTVSGNIIKLTITKGSFFKGANFADQVCTGTFGADCTVRGFMGRFLRRLLAFIGLFDRLLVFSDDRLGGERVPGVPRGAGQEAGPEGVQRAPVVRRLERGLPVPRPGVRLR